MSKINQNKINYDSDEFVVRVNSSDFDDYKNYAPIKEEPIEQEPQANELELVQTQYEKEREQARKIIEEANIEKAKIVEDAKIEARKIIDEANNKAQEIENNSKTQAQELLKNSQDELENIRIQATKDGYTDGHNEGVEKAQEELVEKIEDFNKFCSSQKEVKEKILKSASKDIVDIIVNISKKILLKEVDGKTLEKIIKKTVELLEKKEDINIILSTKYAKLLFDLQNKNLDNDEEIEFENFKQYEGFNIIYSPDFKDDTIIVENLKERFDSSISSQADILIRDIYEKAATGLDLEEYNSNEAE